MKKFKNCLLSLSAVLLLASCSSGTNVSIGVGNGKIPDDAIYANFSVADSFKDGYKISGKFTAKKNANLETNYVFAIADSDPVFSSSYNESVLVKLTGDMMKATKKSNGTYGGVKFSIQLTNLSSYFTKTSESKDVYCVLRDENYTDRTDITKVNSSHFNYTFDGTTVRIAHA